MAHSLSKLFPTHVDISVGGPRATCPWVYGCFDICDGTESILVAFVFGEFQGRSQRSSYDTPPDSAQHFAVVFRGPGSVIRFAEYPERLGGIGPSL